MGGSLGPHPLTTCTCGGTLSPINILKRIPVVTSEPMPGGLRGEQGWREQEWCLH